MRETGGINNRGAGTRTDYREWNANVHFFFVGTHVNLDEIVGRGVIDGGLDTRETVMGPGHGSLADGGEHNRVTDNQRSAQSNWLHGSSPQIQNESVIAASPGRKGRSARSQARAGISFLTPRNGSHCPPIPVRVKRLSGAGLLRDRNQLGSVGGSLPKFQFWSPTGGRKAYSFQPGVPTQG